MTSQHKDLTSLYHYLTSLHNYLKTRFLSDYVDLPEHSVDMLDNYVALIGNDVDLSDIKLTRRGEASTRYKNKIFSF